MRGALNESGPSANEQKVLDSVTKRVRMWHDVEPFYPDQTTGLPKITIGGNTVQTFDKNGITVSYAAANAAISNNTVTGTKLSAVRMNSSTDTMRRVRASLGA